jgi:hypothetical protein
VPSGKLRSSTTAAILSRSGQSSPCSTVCHIHGKARPRSRRPARCQLYVIFYEQQAQALSSQSSRQTSCDPKLTSCCQLGVHESGMKKLICSLRAPRPLRWYPACLWVLWPATRRLPPAVASSDAARSGPATDGLIAMDADQIARLGIVLAPVVASSAMPVGTVPGWCPCRRTRAWRSPRPLPARSSR